MAGEINGRRGVLSTDETSNDGKLWKLVVDWIESSCCDSDEYLISAEWGCVRWKSGRVVELEVLLEAA